MKTSGYGSRACPLVDGPLVAYRTIVVDPPWLERGGGKIKRGADRHYPLLNTGEIIETILRAPCWKPNKDSHLYLWVTNNHLREGLVVLNALGFRYVTNVVWVKDRIGLGQYFRGQHELVLFGVRGRLPSGSRRIPSVIHARRTLHSKKPDELFSVAEQISAPPFLEMFARRLRPHWDVWGNEVPAQASATQGRPVSGAFLRTSSMGDSQ